MKEPGLRKLDNNCGANYPATKLRVMAYYRRVSI